MNLNLVHQVKRPPPSLMQYRSSSLSEPSPPIMHSEQQRSQPLLGGGGGGSGTRTRRSTDWQDARFEEEDPLGDIHIAHIHPPNDGSPAATPRLESPKSVDNVLRSRSTKSGKHRLHSAHSPSSPRDDKDRDKASSSKSRGNKTIFVVSGRPKSQNNTPPRPIAVMFRKHKRSRKSSLEPIPGALERMTTATHSDTV